MNYLTFQLASRLPALLLLVCVANPAEAASTSDSTFISTYAGTSRLSHTHTSNNPLKILENETVQSQHPFQQLL